MDDVVHLKFLKPEITVVVPYDDLMPLRLQTRYTLFVGIASFGKEVYGADGFVSNEICTKTYDCAEKLDPIDALHNDSVL